MGDGLVIKRYIADGNLAVGGTVAAKAQVVIFTAVSGKGAMVDRHGTIRDIRIAAAHIHADGAGICRISLKLGIAQGIVAAKGHVDCTVDFGVVVYADAVALKQGVVGLVFGLLFALVNAVQAGADSRAVALHIDSAAAAEGLILNKLIACAQGDCAAVNKDCAAAAQRGSVFGKGVVVKQGDNGFGILGIQHQGTAVAAGCAVFGKGVAAQHGVVLFLQLAVTLIQVQVECTAIIAGAIRHLVVRKFVVCQRGVAHPQRDRAAVMACIVRKGAVLQRSGGLCAAHIHGTAVAGGRVVGEDAAFGFQLAAAVKADGCTAGSIRPVARFAAVGILSKSYAVCRDIAVVFHINGVGNKAGQGQGSLQLYGRIFSGLFLGFYPDADLILAVAGKYAARTVLLVVILVLSIGQGKAAAIPIHAVFYGDLACQGIAVQVQGDFFRQRRNGQVFRLVAQQDNGLVAFVLFRGAERLGDAVVVGFANTRRIQRGGGAVFGQDVAILGGGVLCTGGFAIGFLIFQPGKAVLIGYRVQIQFAYIAQGNTAGLGKHHIARSGAAVQQAASRHRQGAARPCQQQVAAHVSGVVHHNAVGGIIAADGNIGFAAAVHSTAVDGLIAADLAAADGQCVGSITILSAAHADNAAVRRGGILRKSTARNRYRVAVRLTLGNIGVDNTAVNGLVVVEITAVDGYGVARRVGGDNTAIAGGRIVVEFAAVDGQCVVSIHIHSRAISSGQVIEFAVLNGNGVLLAIHGQRMGIVVGTRSAVAESTVFDGDAALITNPDAVEVILFKGRSVRRNTGRIVACHRMLEVGKRNVF